MSDSKTTDKYTAMSFEAMYDADESEPDGRPLELDIDTLHPFPNQPFHTYKEDEMDKMVESIQENGVISPIIVRPKENGTYEIISGHNRVEACRRAGITQIPSFIREVDDDTAVILMVDSNLRQREELSDMEKARAYELKMDALRRQGHRSDLSTSCQLGRKLDLGGKEKNETAGIIGRLSDDSSRQVHRYIRLNHLIKSLQDAVEDKKIAFNPAVEISYLDPADQAIVQEIMEREETAPSLSQAQKLKKMAQDKTINDQRIVDVLTVEKPMYETITFRFNTIEKFFPAGTTGKQMEQKIYEWMERYRRQWQSREEKAQEQER